MQIVQRSWVKTTVSIAVVYKEIRASVNYNKTVDKTTFMQISKGQEESIRPFTLSA